MKKNHCLLLLTKDEEKYIFKYVPGNEKNLFFALLEMGRNDDYNVNLVEVFHIIRRVSNFLQKHGVGKDLSIELPLL